MTDLKIIEEAFPLQGDFAQDAKYTWPSRWEAVKNDLAHVPEVAPQFSPQFWCKSQNTVGGEHEGVPCCTQCASCELEQCKRRVAELESAPGAPRSPQRTTEKS